MKKLLVATLAAALLLSPTLPPAVAADSAKIRQTREKADKAAADTLERLLKDSGNARFLKGKSYGYAVFDVIKAAFGVSGAGGTGVAVGGGRRVYMRMASAGIGLGLGAQAYQVVFLFENQRAFDDFVNKGWEVGTRANAAAGTAGASAGAGAGAGGSAASASAGDNGTSTFTDGMAVYQLTEAGLMAQVDIHGTKYWAPKNLNGR